MLLRWASSVTIVGFWLGSMTWLVAHDLWPEWTAKDVPRIGIDALPLHNPEPTQVGIYDASDRRIGAIWTAYTGSTDLFTRTDELRLDYVPGIGSFLVVSDTDFETGGLLRAFRIGLHIPGAEFPISVDAERFNDRIAVAIRAGAYYQALDLDGGKTAMVSDLFRPFYRLPDLKVGQSWRMQVLDPLKLVLRSGDPFTPMIVRVTEQRRAMHRGTEVKCFLVECSQASALVLSDGTVIEQEVSIPGLGLVRLRDEEYDRDLREEAMKLLPNRTGWRYGEPQ